MKIGDIYTNRINCYMVIDVGVAKNCGECGHVDYRPARVCSAIVDKKTGEIKSIDVYRQYDFSSVPPSLIPLETYKALQDNQPGSVGSYIEKYKGDVVYGAFSEEEEEAMEKEFIDDTKTLITQAKAEEREQQNGEWSLQEELENIKSRLEALEEKVYTE